MKIRIKPKETHYAEKKMMLIGKCWKCKRSILFEKMYIGHNGPYKWKFCTDCIHSIEEAKEASVVKRPMFAPI